MKTVTKNRIARAAYRLIHFFRLLVGRPDRVIAIRAGVAYQLDLNEVVDFVIYMRSYFEPNTTQALKRNISKSDIVLDVGANIGAHTFHMANFVGDNGFVYAFEPTETAYKKLYSNLELNPTLKSRVKIFQYFLSDKDSLDLPKDICSSWPLIGDKSKLHPKHLGKAVATKGGETRSLDSLVEELEINRIDLVKMDVDGFECRVLSGFQKTMSRDLPTFIMEYSPYQLEEQGHSSEEFLGYFLRLGYKFYFEKNEEPLPMDLDQIHLLVEDGASINIIAKV